MTDRIINRDRVSTVPEHYSVLGEDLCIQQLLGPPVHEPTAGMVDFPRSASPNPFNNLPHSFCMVKLQHESVLILEQVVSI